MSKENFFDIAYTLKTSEDARQMYDRWSEVYDQDLNNGNYQQPIRCANALLEQAPNKDIKILDVGCGTGLSGLALKETGFQNIDGCDLSQGMLDKASELKIYKKLFSCNLNEPPIDAKDEEYDALTAVGVFSFGHIMPEAVEELLRVTRKNGIIIIGLNDHYYDEGLLTHKLVNLQSEKNLNIIKQVHGEHIPGNDLKGWVITLKKT